MLRYNILKKLREGAVDVRPRIDKSVADISGAYKSAKGNLQAMGLSDEDSSAVAVAAISSAIKNESNDDVTQDIEVGGDVYDEKEKLKNSKPLSLSKKVNGNKK